MRKFKVFLRGENDPSDPPMLFADEIDEVDSFDGIESLTPGLIFFPDEPSAQVRQGHP